MSVLFFAKWVNICCWIKQAQQKLTQIKAAYFIYLRVWLIRMLVFRSCDMRMGCLIVKMCQAKNVKYKKCKIWNSLKSFKLKSFIFLSRNAVFYLSSLLWSTSFNRHILSGHRIWFCTPFWMFVALTFNPLPSLFVLVMLSLHVNSLSRLLFAFGKDSG